MSSSESFTQAPDVRLDYAWDWHKWLEEDEIITDREITGSSPGLTIESQAAAFAITEDGKTVIDWMTGGLVGESYKITCKIFTSAGRQDKRTITIRCQNR